MIADAYWPGADPEGRCVFLEQDSVCSTVVGVVENVMVFRLVKDDRPMIYLPPAHVTAASRSRPRALILRVNADPRHFAPLLRREIQALGPRMPFVNVEPYAQTVAPQLRPWRLGATMFTIFGVIALTIAAVGLFSVLAYWVSQRRHEIGVRMALGARRSDVVRLVAVQMSRAVFTGLIVGIAAAFFASRWLSDLLYETSPRDPLVYGIATVVLLLAAILASVFPARQSASVDPATALRID